MSDSNNNGSTSTGNTNIKTDDKKQHFDDIYVAITPVPYKVRILDELHYISDDFNREMFDRYITPWINKSKQAKDGYTKLKYVDLCCCFGNTTMACINGMSYNEICENWKDEITCMKITKSRRFEGIETTGIDISSNALQYGKTVGLFDTTICGDLNSTSTTEFQQVLDTMKTSQIFLSTASLVYLDLSAIELILKAFAEGTSDTNGENEEKYMLVNFLNPFSLDKADDTKKLLLKYLEFVGSMATRHRKLSKLEQNNYPEFGQYALLELWVLKTKSTTK